MTEAKRILDMVEGWHEPYPRITEVFDDYKTMYGIEQVEVECFDYKKHEAKLPTVETFLGRIGQGDFDGFMQGGESFRSHENQEGAPETKALFEDFESHCGMR